MNILKDLIKEPSVQLKNYIITINGIPVHDYKHRTDKDIIYLISTESYQVPQEEYVTVEELKNFVVNCMASIDSLTFNKEDNSEKIQSYTVNDKTKTINIALDE